MDIKKYSLYDIFGFLSDATQELQNSVQVDYQENGISTQEDMRLNEYIAMTLAHEFVSDTSRMASDIATSTKEDVISAMKAHGYDEVAFPEYGKYFGIIMNGGKRNRSYKRNKTKKNKQSCRKSAHSV
jgi:hypothetical protein